MNTASTLDVGLLWHSDRSGNLGVGALTVGNISIARLIAHELGVRPKFTIFGSRDHKPSYIDDPDVRFFGLDAKSTLGPCGFTRAVAKLDCMLDIGAGDSFADIYGAKRFFWMMATKALTVARGVPLMLSPQTIGPFTKPVYRQAARWALRHADCVMVRDAKSGAAVGELAPGVAPRHAVDVAFALPWTPPVRGNNRPRIGINVSGLLWNHGYTGKDEFNLGYDYVALMRGLIEKLIADDAADLELICHVNGDAGAPDDDGAVADALAAQYPALRRVPDFASPSAAKSHISGLDALVGARMHACIAAFSSGVPVIPVSYSRKFEGLFGSLGYRRLVPHVGTGTEAALAMLTGWLGEREAMRAEVADGLTRVESALDVYRDELRKLFREVTATAPVRARRSAPNRGFVTATQ